jgi:hypothetical protein
MSTRLYSIGDYNYIAHKICSMNKHKKNKSKGRSLGERHKFYKTIMWHKFHGRNHITSAIFPNT